jgi:formylglycine-generating enzyme required for sulfatase activity
MARIPGGRYVPLFAHGPGSVTVGPFALDRVPVTRGEYLAFVAANPAWRPGRIPRAYAGPGYLAGWASTASAGTARLPATGVSWHAARAYCAWRGKRLPTTGEWELAALASERSRDASRDPAFAARLLRLYTSRSARPVGSTFRNVYGVSDLHGLVWEWTLDFDATGDSHASHASHGSHAASGGNRALSCAAGAVGASDPANYAAFLRYGFRSALNGRTTTDGLGFRCAQDL